MADSRLGNFQSCCRLCLCEKLDTLKSVFDEAIEDRSLPQKILQFVAIEITNSDKITTMVCSQCITKVNNWHEYKQECSDNQSKLQKWLNSCPTNGIADMSIQIKEEPSEEPSGETDENMSEAPENNIVEVLVKNELMEQPDEPMEEEYNELPPPLTPHPPDSNMDSENSQDSGSVGTLNNRQCSICNKLFSSSGNRRKHEKQIHGKHQPGADVGRRSQMNQVSLTKSFDDAVNLGNHDIPHDALETQENAERLDPLSETEQQKIQFAAGLKLLQRNSTPISCEPLSKIELSYIEKCKAMAAMHKSLECACHNVAHPNLKGLLSHLRALRIWFPVFTCYNCMITFTDRSTFTKHSVRCPKTPLETIIKLSNLKKRSEVKTRLYQNFKCTSCKFMYSFHDDYCKHVDEEHIANEPPVICTCGRNFDNMEDFKDHVYVSCLVEYYCDICFITTKNLDAFQKHAAEVHDNSEGFILLQDDNYKMRKPFHHKEASDESVIVTGKRERRLSIKTPILEPDDDEDTARKGNNPTILSANSRECPLCGKEYSSHNNMIRHYKTHLEVARPVEATDDSFYSCPECGGMYNTNEWQEHLAEKHEPKTCGECGKVFQFQSELDQHRSVHLNLKVYRDSKTQSYKTTMISPGSEGGEIMLMCEICDVMFGTKEELKDHKLTHEGNIPLLEPPEEQPPQVKQESKYSCKPCNKFYSSYGGIWDHNKKKHPEKKTPFTDEWPKQCKMCDKVCATGAAYYRHKQVHERERMSAENADMLPSKMPMMKAKREAGTEDDEQSYHTCKRCFKVFSSRYNLKNHMKSHGININPTNKKIAKKVWCDICHQSFANNDTLAKHREEHGTEEMPQLTNQVEGLGNKVPFIFTCDVCVMTFNTKMALKKHKEKHALEQKPNIHKPVQVYCKYCKIAFDSVALLTKHMHIEHEETAKPKTNKIKEKPRQFNCNICKKNFLTSSALSTHMGWHKRSPNTGDNSKPAKVLKQNKIINKLTNNFKIKQEPIDTPLFQCATCLAELPNDTALQVHILEKHRSVSAIMLIPRCNICNKDFNNQDEYETHKRLHDFLERQKQHEQQMLLQKQEAEEQSEELMDTASSPSAGKEILPKQKPLALPPSSMQAKFIKGFPCKYCNAAFSRADTLSGHIRQYHKEYVQNEFKCTQCDRVFDKQNSLSIHLKVHEKQRTVVSSSAKPLFSCSICSMGFDLPKDLRAHTINAHPF